MHNYLIVFLSNAINMIFKILFIFLKKMRFLTHLQQKFTTVYIYSNFGKHNQNSAIGLRYICSHFSGPPLSTPRTHPERITLREMHSQMTRNLYL